jgi:hypothetical protein
LGIKSNVCISHAVVTFNSFVLSHATGNVQLRCVSGIASAHRSHVKQFPDVAAYDDYYDILVDTTVNLSVGMCNYVKNEVPNL